MFKSFVMYARNHLSSPTALVLPSTTISETTNIQSLHSNELIQCLESLFSPTFLYFTKLLLSSISVKSNIPSLLLFPYQTKEYFFAAKEHQLHGLFDTMKSGEVGSVISINFIHWRVWWPPASFHFGRCNHIFKHFH